MSTVSNVYFSSIGNVFFVTSKTNPDLHPSILGAPLAQTPTNLFQERVDHEHTLNDLQYIHGLSCSLQWTAASGL